MANEPQKITEYLTFATTYFKKNKLEHFQAIAMLIAMAGPQHFIYAIVGESSGVRTNHSGSESHLQDGGLSVKSLPTSRGCSESWRQWVAHAGTQ